MHFRLVVGVCTLLPAATLWLLRLALAWHWWHLWHLHVARRYCLRWRLQYDPNNLLAMVATMNSEQAYTKTTLGRVESRLETIDTGIRSEIKALQSHIEMQFVAKSELVTAKQEMTAMVQTVAADVANMKANSKPFVDTFWEIVKYVAIAVIGGLVISKLF